MKIKFILMMALVQSVYSADFVVDGSNISMSISSRDYNRIAFKDDQINQAFYKKTDFLIKLDEVNGQLFILPRNKESKYPLSLTITSVGRLTQHFFFKPANIGSQTIMLKAPKKLDVVEKHDVQLEKYIDKLANKSVKLKRLALSVDVNKGWKLKRLGIHKFEGGYQGHVLTLKNISNESRKVRTKMLWRDSSCAMNIVNQDLEPGDVTSVYMVTKGDF